MNGMKAWIYAFIIMFIIIIICVFAPWLFLVVGISLLIMFFYTRYGSSQKREFTNLKKENSKKRRIQELEKKALVMEEQESNKLMLKEAYEIYKEKKLNFFEKNNIDDKPYIFWERYGVVEKIHIWKKNGKVYLCNNTNSFTTFKEDYKIPNNDCLFNKIGIIETNEDNIVIVDNSHTIKDTYHYTDPSNSIILGSLFFGTAGAIAGAMDSSVKTKTLQQKVVDVTIRVKNLNSSMAWIMNIDPSMLVTIAEELPNVKVDVNDQDEYNDICI